MAMPVKRLVTTKGRDENIVETVAFPCNEDEIATWFHVNELDELQFAGGSASDLTVPEFNPGHAGSRRTDTEDRKQYRRCRAFP